MKGDGARFGPDRQMACSFCGKHQGIVKKLIAGPGVFICDECVNLCVDILDDEGVSRFRPAGTRVEMPRDELVRIARVLDQAAGAIGATNVRVADEVERLAGAVHKRLETSGGDPPPAGPETS